LLLARLHRYHHLRIWLLFGSQKESKPFLSVLKLIVFAKLSYEFYSPL
jgi:hypothetical protein